MSDQQKSIEDRAISLRAAGRILFDVAADLIYEDSHHWSTRPCSTCQAITAIMSKPFGCIRYAKEQR